MRNYLLKFLLAALACIALAACSTNATRKVEYQKAGTLPPLEVPPEMSAPELQGEMDLPLSFAGLEAVEDAPASARVLQEQANVRVLHDRDMHWLEIQSEPDRIWSRLRDFWEAQGLEVKVDEPRLGIMETQWAENKADVPGDWITSMISKVFKNIYSAPTRDKFRMRVERGQEPGITEVFIAHYGLEEVMRGKNVETFDTIWQPRPADPELVAVMLNRMMVYLGVPQEIADQQLAEAVEAPSRTRLQGDVLRINENFPRAWRRVGIALDRLGLVVEDQDRSAGEYFIRPLDQVAEAEKKGFFSRMFSRSKKDEEVPQGVLRIRLEEAGEQTLLSVHDVDEVTSGQHGQGHQKILQQLEAELR